MYILLWLLFGAIIGILANAVTRGNSRMGLIGNIVVGLLGSLIGSLITQAIYGTGITVFTLEGFLFSVLGAIILLGVINLVFRN